MVFTGENLDDGERGDDTEAVPEKLFAAGVGLPQAADDVSGRVIAPPYHFEKGRSYGNVWQAGFEPPQAVNGRWIVVSCPAPAVRAKDVW